MEKKAAPVARRPAPAVAATPAPACVLRIAVRRGDYLHVVADQGAQDLSLTLLDARGRRLFRADSLTAEIAPSLPPEELHWVADAAGDLRVEGACGLRLAEHRRATATDRRRVLAEEELASAHALRQTRRPETCRAGVAAYESAQRRFADLRLPRRRAEAFLGLDQLQRECLHDDGAALRTFVRAEPLFAGHPAFESVARQWLGKLRYESGDVDGAIADFRRALELRQRLGDRAGEADTSSSLGHMLRLRGRYDEAAALLDRSLALWRPGDDRGERANALVNRGHLHRELGELDAARGRFEEALGIFRQIRDRHGEGVTLNALALLALDAGKPREALAPLEQSLALRPRGTREWAVTRNTMGVAWRQLGRQDDARRAYEEALPIFRRVGDVPEQARCLGNLGRLEATAGRDGAALADFDRAAALYRKLDDPPDLAWALEGKARMLRRRGDPERARGLMEEALAQIERQRSRQTNDTTRADFFGTWQDSYGFLIGLLMEMHGKAPAAGYDAAALEVSERSLARSLLDGLAAGGLDVERAGDARYAALIRSRPWSAGAIRRDLLDRDTLLLEYRLDEERSFLWAVTPDGLATFELPGRAAIEELARPACDLLSRKTLLGAGSAEPRLARLSRLLLGPVAPRLAGKRLVVVGGGILQSLPFAALPEPGRKEPLIARHEIVSLPSASVLGALRRETAGRPPAPKTLWVLADPDFGGVFKPLPHSGEEAAAILGLVPTAQRVEVLGRQADRAAVLRGDLRDYRFLHFATHGSFDPADPGGVGLALAQIGPDGRRQANGFLRLADIYGLRLRADLVVLSACQSALGREVPGEGMMGMTRGFFHAGARRVVVSLWNVDDQVTAELMRRFYRGMLAEGLSPTAALRAAQDSLRAGGRSPYYWAGFTLQGEWRGDRARRDAGGARSSR